MEIVVDIKLFFQAIIKFTLGLILVGGLLFIPANTFDYWNGWLFIGLLFVPMFIAGIILMVKKPELLKIQLKLNGLLKYLWRFQFFYITLHRNINYY